MRRPAFFVSAVLLAAGAPFGPALAERDFPEAADDRGTAGVGEADTGETSAEARPGRPFVPPRIDYSGSQAVGPGTSLYLDTTYQTTSDLSTFWWVRGRGLNYRVAAGGTYQNGGFQASVELPVQYTVLTIDTLMGSPPTNQDRQKATVSLGDVVTALAQWWELGGGTASSWLGVGLRVRLPTHTTRYRFGLIDGSTLEFGFPYYVHLAPAALWSMRYGPLSLLVNQGVLGMVAKDISLDGVIQPIPDVYFWESHVAAGVDAADWLALSVELASFVQLNQVAVESMNNLNDTRAVFVNPGATLLVGRYRLAVAGRIGLGDRSVRDFGVITFSGTHALLARLSYVF